MGDVTFAAAVLLWGLLPGLLLLWLADVRWSSVERIAAAPGLSLALGACAAYLAEIAGLPVKPLPVLIVLLIVCALIFVARQRRRGRDAKERSGASGSPRATEPGGVQGALSKSDAKERSGASGSPRATEPGGVQGTPPEILDLPPGLRWMCWLVLLLPLAVVAQLEPVWGTALLPPSLHDGLDHANWFRLIYETASLDPDFVRAPPLTPAGEPTYYPWGLHGWAALLAQTTALDPVAVWMRAMVLISAALPLSVYSFVAYFTGRGWTAMAAALLSLLFWWLPYQIWGWGGYPLLAGTIAALPVSRLALSAVDRWHWAAIAAASVCMVGLLAIHPSQLFAALVMSAVVSVTLAASGALKWRAAAPFLIALAIAVVVLIAGGSFWQPIAGLMERARSEGAALSVDPRYRWPIGAYFDLQLPLPDTIRLGLTLLCALGGVVAIIDRRVRPLLVLHLTFGALVLIARYQTWMTGLWYHMPERIWYAQAASVPALGALGIAAIVQLIVRVMALAVAAASGMRVKRWLDLSRWPLAAWAVVTWLVFAPLHERFEPWADWRLFHAVHRNPQLSFNERRVLPDFAWMRANIPRGEAIFNAPADWGVSLPFTGRRTVFWSGGYAIDPTTAWNNLLALMRRGDPYASHAAAEISSRAIRYVYAARLSAALERRGRLPLEGDALRDAAAFELLYESPTALIMRVPDVRPTLLGLRDSDRIRFEGFHPMEQHARRRWRWTAGSGRLSITPGPEAARECFVRILGPNPDTYEVRQNGAPVAFTPWGHRVVRDTPDTGPIAVDIVSPRFTPDPATGDTRVLGVSVANVGFSCVARAASTD